MIGSSVALSNSTVSANSAGNYGGGISGSTVQLGNSTVTGNRATGKSYSDGGGIVANAVTIASSIVAGNSAPHGSASDVRGSIVASDGHNIFGSDIAGAIDGDREGIAPGLLFATFDPINGGGVANAAGVSSCAPAPRTPP